MGKPDDDIEVIACQLVAQGMLIQILMSPLVLLSADRGAGVRQALADGVGVMQRNPNMRIREKFGAVKTLEDALDTFDRVREAMPDS
tara:strand:- start:7154 stop:7414 length:261 start_codon:yes stop_codon:yes gene_type:complete